VSREELRQATGRPRTRLGAAGVTHRESDGGVMRLEPGGPGTTSEMPAGIRRIVLPTRYPVGPVNVYLIEADPPALVDVGPDTDEAFEALAAGLRDAGARPSDLGAVLITHTHPDHCRGLGRLRLETNVPVYAHEGCTPELKVGADWREQYLRFLRTFAAECGVPESEMNLLQAAQRLVRSYSLPELPGVEVRTEGSWGDATGVGAPSGWRLLITPGHTGSSLCALRESDGVLVAGDTLLPHISSNAIVEPMPAPGGLRRRRMLPEYLRTLRRLASFDLSAALPGHGDPVTDHRSLIEERLGFYRERQDYVASLLEACPASVFELRRAMFPDLDPINSFFALSEVVGQLDVMEEDGRVSPLPPDDSGVVRYALAR